MRMEIIQDDVRRAIGVVRGNANHPQITHDVCVRRGLGKLQHMEALFRYLERTRRGGGSRNQIFEGRTCSDCLFVVRRPSHSDDLWWLVNGNSRCDRSSGLRRLFGWLIDGRRGHTRRDLQLCCQQPGRE